VGDRPEQQIVTDALEDTRGTCLIRNIEMVPLLGLQLADHFRLREEHQPSKERHPQTAVLRGGATEQTFELLGLLVR
jgi:hypothetical protein